MLQENLFKFALNIFRNPYENSYTYDPQDLELSSEDRNQLNRGIFSPVQTYIQILKSGQN